MINYAFSLKDFEYFILILVRIVCFFVTVPFFGDRVVPNRVKIGFAFFTTIIISSFVAKPQLDYSGVIGYAIIVLREGITGLLIGFSASVCNSIILFAGNIIDMDIGLSMATEFNPMMNAEVTISGNLYQYFVLLLLIATDMYTFIFRAICDSFSIIPIAGAQFAWDNLLKVMIKYMGDLCVIGFRIFLPFFAAIMILNCILGIMAKVAPQMNMFAIGMQLKVLLGFTVMFLAVYMIPSIANFISIEMKNMIVLMIEGMS